MKEDNKYIFKGDTLIYKGSGVTLFAYDFSDKLRFSASAPPFSERVHKFVFKTNNNKIIKLCIDDREKKEKLKEYKIKLGKCLLIEKHRSISEREYINKIIMMNNEQEIVV